MRAMVAELAWRQDAGRRQPRSLQPREPLPAWIMEDGEAMETSGHFPVWAKMRAYKEKKVWGVRYEVR